MVNQKDDQEAKKMVNSYRFKHSQGQKYKIWSPEINMEEVFKRKREREDQYMEKFDSQDKPILLIKQKHNYTGITNPELNLTTDQDTYYKISENTNVIDDVQEEIQNQTGFVRKNTFLHQKNKSVDDDDNSIYKIDGVEFLPEGFLELNPLLYKDEFEFESRLDQKFFSNEQRKIKALRRQQYTQKNYLKMRDVTIYLIDQRKDKIVEYLERWYFKHKRKMDQGEINYVAKLLKCDPQTMSDLQDLFLEKKKYLNTQGLKDYLKKHGRLKNDKIFIPPSLKKYFIKQKQPYRHIKSKIYGKSPKSNRMQKDFNKNTKKFKFSKTNDKIKGFGYNLYKNKTAKFQNLRNNKLSKSQGRLKKSHQQQQSMAYIKQEHFLNQNNIALTSLSERPFGLIRSSSSQLQKSNSKNDSTIKKSQYDELRVYFDSEVNKILDKIQSSNVNDNFQDKLNKKLKNKKLVPKIDKNYLIDDYANRLMKKTSYKIKQNYQVKNASKHLVKSKRSKQELEEIAFQVLQVDKQKPNLKISEQINQSKKLSQTSQKKGSYEYYPEIDSFGGNKQPQANRLILHSEVDENLKLNSHLESGQSKNQLTLKPFLNDLPKRIVSLQKGPEKEIIIQKLKPILVGTEYFYQQVEDIRTKTQREVFLITKNDCGQVVEKINIDKQNRTKYYQNQVFHVNDQNDSFKTLIVVWNDNGKCISILTLKSSIPIYLKNTSINQLKTGNFKKSHIIRQKTKNGIKRIHNLNPQMIFGTMYHQKIIEEIPDNSSKKLTIITLDNKGKLLNEKLIFEDKEDENKEKETAKDLSTYYSQINEEQINNQGQKEIQLVTKNNQGKILNIQYLTNQKQIEYQFQQRQKTKVSTKKMQNKILKIHQLPPIIVGMDYFKQEIEEKIESNGQRTLTLTVKDQLGEIISKDDLDPKFYGNEYLNDIIEDKIGKDGKKNVTVAIRNDRSEIMHICKLKPSINSVLGEQFYDSFVEKHKGKTSIMSMKKKNNKKRQIYLLKPILIGNQYFQQIIEISIETDDLKKIVILTQSQQAEIISKKEIIQKDFRGNDFRTEILEKYFNNKGNESYIIVTKNEFNDVILQQNVSPEIISILNANYFDEFKEQSRGRKSITNQIQHKDSTIRSLSLVPQNINDKYYQQIINEIEDRKGNKSIVIMTRDQRGDLVDLQEIDNNTNIGENCTPEIEEQKNERTITVVIHNSEGEQIGTQQIQDMSPIIAQNKVEIKNEQGVKNIQHTLKPIVINNEIYQQVVNQIKENNQNKLQVITKDQENNILDSQIVDTIFSGYNYFTLITHDFMNDKAIRQIILETQNDRGQTLCTFKIEIKQNQEQEIQFNDQQIQNLDQNEIVSKNKGRVRTTINKIRPTIIGNEVYKHEIEETERDGKRQLTLITKNDKGEEIQRQNLEIDKSGKNYFTYLKNDKINQNGEQIVELEIKNDKGESLAIQNFRTETVTDQKHQYFSDINNVYDNKGNHISTISQKYEKDYYFRSHVLKPLAVGNIFIQQTLNEKIYPNGKKEGVVVLFSETGQIMNQRKIDQDLLKDYYYNLIKEERIDQNQEQVFLIETKNDQDQTVNIFEYRPNQYDSYEDDTNLIIEETVDQNNSKIVYIIKRDSNKRSKIKKRDLQNFGKGDLFAINEQDENQEEIESDLYEKEEIDKINYFESLLKQFSDNNQKRQTYDEKQLYNLKDKSKTFNAKMQNKIRKNTQQNQQPQSKVSGQNTKRKRKSTKRPEKQKKTEEKPKNFTARKFSRDISKKLSNKSKSKKKFSIKQDSPKQQKKYSNQEQIQKQQDDKNNNEHKDINNNQQIEQKEPENMEISQEISQNIIRNSIVADDNNNNLQQSEIIPEQDLDEEQNQLIKKSERLKGYLDDYINTINDSKQQKSKIKPDQENLLKKTIEEVFQKEKEKLSKEIIEKMNQKMMESNSSDYQQDLLDEFYLFCKNILPHDQRYKESIMFISLFYYFLEKKNLLNK